MKKVLIIDDDQFILKVYQKKFETEGLVVEVAADGPSALDTLRKNIPALILLDLMLPGMSGIELLGHIRTLPNCAEIPVIVFSHSFDEKLLDAARSAGAIQCLNKNSVSPNRLLEIVRAALAAPSSSVAPVAAVSIQQSAQPASPGSRDDIRATLARDAISIEARLNTQVQAFAASALGAQRVATLEPLHASFEKLERDASLAALPRLALLARGVTLMLEDLHEHPDEITSSSFRTLARAVEAIPTLFLPRPNQEFEQPSIALVVHAQRGVAPLLAEALRQAGQPAVAFRDPTAALSFVEDNPIELLVADLDLAQPAGGDFIRRCQAIPGRAHMPAVLLSNQPPASTIVPNFLLAHQVLNYPFTANEVVVSALVRLVRRA
jgi:CheY-like chemotaxis protein